MKSVLITALLLLPLATWLISAEPTPKPNIILILADDLGYECIGANGGTSYQTPHLDKLAATGIRFEHCYSQPLCTPSRLQLMTGLYNVRNYTSFGRMNRDQITFAHLLKKQGYATCIAGKWQLGDEVDSPQHFGFDQACLWQHTRKRTPAADTRHVNPELEINGKPVDYTHGEFAPDIVSDFICQFIAQNKDKPFFAYYPMILTHCPSVPTPDSPDYDPKSKGSPTYKGDPKYFGGMVTYMDKIIGKIVAQLEAQGLRENTIILFTGDNGTDVPIVSQLQGAAIAGAKGKPTNAGTHVPLIVNAPGIVKNGRVSQDLIDFTDFLPTLCEAAGLTLAADHKTDGHSFFPQLRGEKGQPRQWIYSWYHRNGGPKAEHEWTRNQRYKLYTTGNFYDISQDALEKNPLSNPSPEETKIRAQLQQALDQFKEARPAQSPDKNQSKPNKKKPKQ